MGGTFLHAGFGVPSHNYRWPCFASRTLSEIGAIGSLSPGGSAILTVLSKAFPLELGAGKFIYLCYTGKETQAA